MPNTNIGSNTIINNDIKQFIFRIDFNAAPPIDALVAALKNDFSRIENRQLVGFEVSVNIPQSKSELSQKDFTDIVLVKDPNVTLTLSAKDNSLCFVSLSYLDNTVYKEISKKIIDVCKNIDNCSARRIGLRYINEIQCSNLSHISKIFQKKFATVVKNMISTQDTSRVIAVQMRNCEDYFLQIQYGTLNKFFPAILKNYDLLLDIDSVSNYNTEVEQWEDTIKKLNHAAYETFSNMVTDTYIRSKKNA